MIFSEQMYVFSIFMDGYYAIMIIPDTDYYEIILVDIITWKVVVDSRSLGSTFGAVFLNIDIVLVLVFDLILGNRANEYVFGLWDFGFPTAFFFFGVIWDAGTEGYGMFKIINS